MVKVAFLFASWGFFSLLTAGLLFHVYKRKLILQNRLDKYFDMQINSNDQYTQGQAKTEKRSILLKTYWNIGVDYINKRISRAERKKLDVMLREAGYPFNWGATEFRLFQFLLAVGLGFLFFLLFLPIVTNKGLGWILIISVSILGYRYPIFYLGKRKAQRIKVINKSMPDFFDMVNVLLEAGMGLDAAIAEVSYQTKGPLGEEFFQALEDMKLGKSRREAFYELRKRVPSDSFQSIMNSLIQADQLGIGMSKVLRNLTVRIREQRREAAREQAMKAPVKMLFPMVLFIFPSLFIVILGPIVVQLVTKGLGG